MTKLTPVPPPNDCCRCGAIDRQTRAGRGTCARCTGEAVTVYVREKAGAGRPAHRGKAGVLS